jgi:hypothetical protein
MEEEMSSHADTIRDELESGGNRAAIEAFEAFEAENQRLREALEFIDTIATSASTAYWKVKEIKPLAREALAGDGE